MLTRLHTYTSFSVQRHNTTTPGMSATSMIEPCGATHTQVSIGSVLKVTARRGVGLTVLDTKIVSGTLPTSVQP